MEAGGAVIAVCVVGFMLWKAASWITARRIADEMNRESEQQAKEMVERAGQIRADRPDDWL